MRKLKYILFAVLAALTLHACDTYSDDYDIEYTAIHPLGGEYTVTITNDANATVYEGIPCIIGNTTNNDKDLCWVRIGTLTSATAYAINGKLSCNVSDLSFTGTNIENLAGNVVSSTHTFSIPDGKVVLKGVTTPSGTVGDKISFTYTTTKNPGVTYKVEGYRYTGWPED